MKGDSSKTPSGKDWIVAREKRIIAILRSQPMTLGELTNKMVDKELSENRNKYMREMNKIRGTLWRLVDNKEVEYKKVVPMRGDRLTKTVYMVK